MAGVASECANNEDKDRISALADGILTHILSLLPTKDAVMTSLLSRRWRSAWTCVTNVELDDSKVSNFEMFAERVMSVHDARIKKFTLRCNDWHNSQLIHQWISTAVMRNVAELDISLLTFEMINLPDCVYTCESLEVLKLAGWFALEVPDSKVVSLKRLKFLSFSWLQIKDDSYMTLLLSGCPVIEEIHIYKSMWEGLSTFSVCSPSLQRLSVDIEGRQVASKHCTFVLDVPNLKYLALLNDVMALSENYFEEQASSIVSARLQVGNWVSPVPVIVKLLNHISSTINDLWISYSTIEPIGRANDYAQLAAFNNLEYLKLEVESFAASHYWSVVHHLLQLSPNLKLLVLTAKGFASFAEWHQPDDVAECLLSNLVTLKVQGVDGEDRVMELIEYYLRNAMVLNQMYISSRVLPEVGNDQIQERLSAFAWGSSTCQLTIS
ncbi:hypothetical protein POUND7_020643 [Theobroma cacao]